MRKRLISLFVVLVLVLSIGSFSALASGTITASYANETVTYAGSGYATGTDYFIRLLDYSRTVMIAMLTVRTDSSGRISSSVRVGPLEDGAYYVYVNDDNGDLAGSGVLIVSSTPGTSTPDTGSGGSSGGSGDSGGDWSSSGGGGGGGSGGRGGGGGGTAAQPGSSFSGSSTWSMGSWSGLEITIQKDFSLFSNVRVNGNALTQNAQYDARSGSTIVTLFPSYLETLELGTYMLEVRFTDGANAITQFTIATQAWQPPTPGPGDGGFIGTPYPEYPVDPGYIDPNVDTGAGAGEAGGTGTPGTFGKVPQTGAQDITGLIVLLCLSTLATVSLCVYMLHWVIKKRRGAGTGASCS